MSGCASITHIEHKGEKYLSRHLKFTDKELFNEPVTIDVTIVDKKLRDVIDLTNEDDQQVDILVFCYVSEKEIRKPVHEIVLPINAFWDHELKNP